MSHFPYIIIINLCIITVDMKFLADIRKIFFDISFLFFLANNYIRYICKIYTFEIKNYRFEFKIFDKTKSLKLPIL